MRFAIIGLLALSQLGCAASAERQRQEIESIDYGEPLSQVEAQAIAKGYFESVLKDPYSAIYDFGSVNTGWLRESILNGRDLHYGYVLDVKVNAKNSFGGYTGATPYKFVILNGRIESIFQMKSGSWTKILPFP